jgi:protein TonB
MPRRATPVPVPAARAPEPLAPPVEAPVALALPVPADPGVLVFPAPPPPADDVVDWHAGIAAPERISGALPAYTECARRVRLAGIVELDAVIGADGRLRELTPVTGLPCGLTEAAVRAVSSWRFRPARRGETPLAVRYRLRVRFELR